MSNSVGHIQLIIFEVNLLQNHKVYGDYILVIVHVKESVSVTNEYS